MNQQEIQIRYDRISQLRNQQGLNQQQVAAELQLEPETYAAYEAGESQTPLAILIKLALLYDTSVDYLLGLTDQPSPWPRAPRR